MHLDPRTLCSACVNVSVGGAGVCVYACACVRVCARRCVHGCSRERVFRPDPKRETLVDTRGGTLAPPPPAPAHPQLLWLHVLVERRPSQQFGISCV